MDELDDVFDDHPSLDVSLEDFERAESPQSHHASPPLEIPSQHSGFREDASDNGTDITEEEGPQPRWSPPGFRHDYVNGSSWYRHQPYMKGEPGRMELVPAGTFSANQSREVTPQFEDAAETPAVKSETDTGELTVPATSPVLAENIVLEKRSQSPTPTDRTCDDDGLVSGSSPISNCRLSYITNPCLNNSSILICCRHSLCFSSGIPALRTVYCILELFAQEHRPCDELQVERSHVCFCWNDMHCIHARSIFAGHPAWDPRFGQII